MKNLKNLWAVALMLVASFAMVSCDEEDPIVDIEEGLNVADGYYFVVDGEDPVAEKALLPEKIEGDGFAPTDRDGYFGNYVFLTAGDYQLQKVESKEVASTLGGTLGDPTVEGDEGYKVAKTEEGGSALTVAENGYYKVSYDETLSELIMMKVTSVQLIGSATPNGWGSGTMLTIDQEASDDGFVFSATDIVMREGEFKIRINDRWTIDRRIDRTATVFDPANGYVTFTNYGGSTSDLVAGGSNMAFAAADEGTYDLTITLTNEGGASFESTRTGDAPEITFDPNDYQFGVTGAATAGGWDASQAMFYKGLVNEAHTWLAVVTFGADGAWKFKTNNELYLGGTLTLDEASISQSGGDIPTPGAGAYYVTLSTADEGSTWNATLVDKGWGLIGIGSPSGSWDVDTFLEASFADGITTYSYIGEFAGGEFKFRAGGAWDYDLGGDLAELSVGGGNLSVEAGTYEVLLTFDGTSYSATITAQ